VQTGHSETDGHVDEGNGVSGCAVRGAGKIKRDSSGTSSITRSTASNEASSTLRRPSAEVMRAVKEPPPRETQA
jgi:hypothetical protein